MQAVANFVAVLVTIPVLIPFAAFAVVYWLLLWKSRPRKQAAAMAVNITTFFLIAAVLLMHGLVRDEESVAAIWWVILFFCLTGGLIGLLQYKIRGKIDAPKVLRAVWRLAFVCFTVAYVVLLVAGIRHFIGQV